MATLVLTCKDGCGGEGGVSVSSSECRIVSISGYDDLGLSPHGASRAGSAAIILFTCPVCDLPGERVVSPEGFSVCGEAIINSVTKELSSSTR